MIGSISPLGKLAPAGLQDNPLKDAAKPASIDFGASFAAALGNAASSTVGNLQNAERLSVEALKGGDVSPREVVDAVMSAEQALQTSIAIRDKIVTAYLEISRMAI